MMYDSALMTHIYVLWAKLVFFKVVLCEFSLMKQLFQKKFFSRTCTLRGKKDVQLTFCDSYLCFLSKTVVFQRSFVLDFANGITFPQKVFL